MSNLPAKRQRGEVSRTRSLYRDPTNGRVGGVCVGLERWTGVPSALWRLGFVLATLLWGVGLLLYAIMWTVMNKIPEEERPEPRPSDLDENEREIWDAVKKDMASLDLENDR